MCVCVYKLNKILISIEQNPACHINQDSLSPLDWVYVTSGFASLFTWPFCPEICVLTILPISGLITSCLHQPPASSLASQPPVYLPHESDPSGVPILIQTCPSLLKTLLGLTLELLLSPCSGACPLSSPMAYNSLLYPTHSATLNPRVTSIKHQAFPHLFAHAILSARYTLPSSPILQEPWHWLTSSPVPRSLLNDWHDWIHSVHTHPYEVGSIPVLIPQMRKLRHKVRIRTKTHTYMW